MIRRISNSEIQTFKDCPRKWWLAWHRGLVAKQTKVTGALAVGVRVHEVLASYYVPDGTPRADLLAELNRLLKEDLATLQAAYDGFVPADEMQDFERESRLQRAMLEGYLDWVTEEGEDSLLEIIEPEAYAEAHLTDEIVIISRLDALANRTSDGALVFVDHKTTGDFLALIRAMTHGDQMKMYRLILSILHPDRKVRGVYLNMIRKVMRTRAAKPPFYMRHFQDFNPIELDTFRMMLRGVVSNIQLAEIQLEHLPHHKVVYTRRSSECDWKCPFKNVCPMFDDGSRAEAYLEDKFTVHNPLSYYEKEDVTRHGA